MSTVDDGLRINPYCGHYGCNCRVNDMEGMDWSTKEGKQILRLAAIHERERIVLAEECLRVSGDLRAHRDSFWVKLGASLGLA